MGDAENSLPPSKKRAAGREISRDNPCLGDEEDSSEQETGTFKRASDEVLANRRIVKVRRNQNTATASSNPFSGICLVPPVEPTVTPAAPSAAPESSTTTTEVTAEAPIASDKEVTEDGKNDVNKCEKNEDGNNQPVEKKADEKDCECSKSESENIKKSESKKYEPVSDAITDKESAEDKGSDVVNEETQKEANDEKPSGVKTEDEDKKDDKTANADNNDKSSENSYSTAEVASLSSFQQLSSSQNAFTGLAGTGFSASSFSFGSTPKDGSTSSVPLFGQKNDQPSFGFGLSTNGNSSLFNTSGTSIVSKSEGSGFPAMQEVPVETGEENEKVVFSADSVLFEFIDAGWKERGKGELKVNVSTTGTQRARVLMRARGNYRLILNASLYPDMKLTNMEKRGISFACMNSTGEKKEGLSTFALKFKDASIVEEFRAAVMAHKGSTASVLKTPENSPRASEG
ncbi:nuclear pore complex protein NUP50A-like [Durio zibethinus]|uniref:Nuclear pore complex protein NUP50A-like n=1 Tax=Durio zibethinus TaxID=66656 RepID=A0A6P5X0U9_DURZI|nr:nuclear pore complex protein NUP50A-like [Durio zibethinus]XP_022721398.1 nuclear pore complex protein NUP50A-like [Durio zibethinus]XP_022721399.1 nuclear pore complex protein NUP50A-like [Durio zibethinus]